MSDWVNAGNVSDFLPGTWRMVDVDDVSVLVFNIDGEFYAIENLCTHDGGTLSDGHLEGDEIVCPRHGAHFCVRTGAVTQPPAYEDVPTFQTRVVGDILQVQDTR